ncbi:hypothetical protein J2X71_006457 [Rhizobium sp. 1399]|nr:hypothetical protein [Rhizobium sp. 1399]
MLADDGHQEFRTKYALAREIQADGFVDEMVEIADDGTNDWMQKNFGEETRWVENGEALRRSQLRILIPDTPAGRAGFNIGIGLIEWAKRLDPRFQADQWFDPTSPLGLNTSGFNSAKSGSLFSAGTFIDLNPANNNLAPTGISQLNGGTSGTWANTNANRTGTGSVATGVAISVLRNVSAVASLVDVGGGYNAQRIDYTPLQVDPGAYFEILAQSISIPFTLEQTKWYRAMCEIQILDETPAFVELRYMTRQGTTNRSSGFSGYRLSSDTFILSMGAPEPTSSPLSRSGGIQYGNRRPRRDRASYHRRSNLTAVGNSVLQDQSHGRC